MRKWREYFDNMPNPSLRSPGFMLWATIALAACSDTLWDPPVPGAVIAERASPDERRLARVVAAQIHGSYVLGVHDPGKGLVLAERTVAAPVGYHPHIVSLTWSDDGRTVTVAIDHDFGDYSSVFDLQMEHQNE